MGFQTFSSPYDWSRIDRYRQIASTRPGGLADLSVGSPVDPVPHSVREGLTRAADGKDAHGYPATVGSPELRQALTGWFRDERGVDLASCGAALLPTVGSKEAVSLMASLLHLGEGDVVVQPAVSYPTYAIGTQLAGARVVTVTDPADVDSWVSIPRVRAIWVNSPSNPTGDVVDVEGLAAIVRAARSIGAVVLSDECYALLTWTPSGPAREAAPCILDPDVCQGSPAGLICLYSLSKQSNMAGYRSAFMAGDPDILGPMATYRKQMGMIISGPVQAAMVAALGDQQAVQTQRDRYYRRLHDLVAALRSFGYQATMPQGGLYIWVGTRGGDCWEDMETLAGLGILPSPGEFYGDATHLRFSATISDAVLDLVLNRLGK